MIKKFKKETSKRKKNSYNDIDLNGKSNFKIRQYFVLNYSYVYRNKRILYKTYEEYRKFRANPFKFCVNSADEYTLISPKHKRKSLAEELKIEKKYLTEKILYCGKIKCSDFDSIKLENIENSLFRLLC